MLSELLMDNGQSLQYDVNLGTRDVTIPHRAMSYMQIRTCEDGKTNTAGSRPGNAVLYMLYLCVGYHTKLSRQQKRER